MVEDKGVIFSEIVQKRFNCSAVETQNAFKCWKWWFSWEAQAWWLARKWARLLVAILKSMLLPTCWSCCSRSPPSWPSWLKAKAVSRPIWSGQHGFNSCHPQHEACFVLSTKQYAYLYWDFNKANCLSVVRVHGTRVEDACACKNTTQIGLSSVILPVHMCMYYKCHVILHVFEV